MVSGYDFTQLPDFGETLHQNIHDWFQSEDNWYIWYELRELVQIAPPAAPVTAVDAGSNPFVGKTVVVTGKVEPYTRGGINAKIESLGAHAGSSVSGKTDYLICGENAGSKLDKARQLGITVLTPRGIFPYGRRVRTYAMLERVAKYPLQCFQKHQMNRSGIMFDIRKRSAFQTVGELRALLNHLRDDTTVCICGDANCFFHEERDGSAVCLDYEDLNYHYEEALEEMLAAEAPAERDKHLESFWAELTDVPVSPETACIDAPFSIFPTGTHREDIWRWFDERHSKGVALLDNDTDVLFSTMTGLIPRCWASSKRRPQKDLCKRHSSTV